MRSPTFASADEPAALLGLTAGFVAPFGLLDGEARRAELLLDGAGDAGVRPSDSTATVRVKIKELRAQKPCPYWKGIGITRKRPPKGCKNPFGGRY